MKAIATFARARLQREAAPHARTSATQGKQTASGRSHKPTQGGSIPPPASITPARHGDRAQQMLVVYGLLALVAWGALGWAVFA